MARGFRGVAAATALFLGACSSGAGAKTSPSHRKDSGAVGAAGATGTAGAAGTEGAAGNGATGDSAGMDAMAQPATTDAPAGGSRRGAHSDAADGGNWDVPEELAPDVAEETAP